MNNSNLIPNETLQKNNPSENTSGSWWDLHTIWDYFVNHLSVFITCVSATIAIVTFLTGIIAYGRDAIYLQKFGIDPSYITVTGNIAIYGIFSSILYSLSSGLVMWYASTAFSSATPHFSVIFGCIYATKQHKKSLKLLNQEREQFCKIQRQRNDAQKYVILNNLRKADERTRKIAKEIAYTKRLLVKSIFQQSGILLFKCILASLLYLLATALMHIYSGNLGLSTIIVWVIFIGFIVISICKDAVKLNRKITTEFMMIKEKSLHEKIKEFEKKSKQPCRFSFATGFSNNVFLHIVISLIISILTTLVLEFTLAWTSTTLKDEFNIYQDQQGTYAIIYHSNDTYIMQEAVIRDNTITIDPSQQRVLKSDDISFTTMEFENVTHASNEEKKQIGASVESQQVE